MPTHVMLVSRNVFYVISALQSIVFIQIFLAGKISCRSYVGNVFARQAERGLDIGMQFLVIIKKNIATIKILLVLITC